MAKKKHGQAFGSFASLNRRPQPPPDEEEGLLHGLVWGALAEGRSVKTATMVAEIGAEAMEGALRLGWSKTLERPACRKGCSYCCRGLRVDVSPPEIIRLALHAKSSLSPEVLASVAERAKENAKKTHGKRVLRYPIQLPCALLGAEGECLAYEARPLACRKEHSLDVEVCKTGFEDQTPDVDTALPRSEAPFVLSNMAFMSYVKAIEAAGVDGVGYELQEALHIALSNPNAIDEWVKDGSPFRAARLDPNEPPPPPPQPIQLRRK